MNKSAIACPGLYAITPDVDPRSISQRIEAVLAQGISLMQYRRKTADSHQREQEVDWLLQRCREYGVPLLINDDVALCQRIGAQGVHLGKDDVGVAEARQSLGMAALIGASAYADLARAQQLREQGADYVAFGRLFASRSKPDAPGADLSVLTRARAVLDCPIVGIGGIDRSRASQVFAAGADLCAMIDGLFGEAGE